jgi:hypothetical protein
LIHDVIDHHWIVRRADPNSTTNLEVNSAFLWIVCDIDVEMESSLLGSGLCELASAVDWCVEDVVRRVWLHVLGWTVYHGFGVVLVSFARELLRNRLSA